MNKDKIEWCTVPVAVDDTVVELIQMEPPNHDVSQKPEFRVTQATMGLVKQDFERYKPSLERMVVTWQEEKSREMATAKALVATKAA